MKVNRGIKEKFEHSGFVLYGSEHIKEITGEQIKRKILNVNSEELPDIEAYEIPTALGAMKNSKMTREYFFRD